MLHVFKLSKILLLKANLKGSLSLGKTFKLVYRNLEVSSNFSKELSKSLVYFCTTINQCNITETQSSYSLPECTTKQIRLIEPTNCSLPHRECQQSGGLRYLIKQKQNGIAWNIMHFKATIQRSNFSAPWR